MLKENGVLQEEPPVKLPDHAPVEDVNALIAEMNKVSILSVDFHYFLSTNTHKIKELELQSLYAVNWRTAYRER